MMHLYHEKKKAEQGSSTNVSYHPRGELDHHNSTENSNQGCEKHAEIVDSKEPRHIDGEDGHAELQRSSVSLEKSPWEIPDEDILSLIALEEKMQSTPSTQSRFCYNFSSTLVEKEVFKDIIDRIPFDAPSPRVVQIKKNWIDHKTFGLSMRVFGKVSKYAIDIMGQALTAEQYEKAELELLPAGFWFRHIVQYERARLLQNPNANVQSISQLFTEPIRDIA
ncbi:hypothetical protein BS78_K010500 [Paspalum vaginatum]|uniref:Uncharacterized protein n=1 Tax=Paspalum vaginatum TaxID=158149 RepID=A0A9W7XDU1_9POAL|nr:hypothetical protein BS78_K019500 [Paspalum vaginatum]KAJ1256538.1 hypothetical protein BS78_K010500 [Paspalum vaginatum]